MAKKLDEMVARVKAFQKEAEANHDRETQAFINEIDRMFADFESRRSTADLAPHLSKSGRSKNPGRIA